MESKKESAQEGALLRSPKQTSDEGWAAATGLLSKKAMASPISGVSESSKLSRSKSILTEEAPIKNKKKSSSVCEEPVSRAVEQLSNMLVHSLDDDEFRNMLSIASKPRYGAINNTFDHESGTVNDDTRDEVEDIQERNKISVTTGLILHQIQRIAEEKQRKEDIEAEQRNSAVMAFISESSANKKAPSRLAKCSSQMVEHVEKRKCDVTQSTPALDQLASAKTDTSRLSNICSKPECAVIEIGDCCVEGKSERDVTTNTNTATIAYIDEEEHEFADKGESVMLSKEPTSAVPHSYTKGNIVHELHALNESDKEDGFDNEVSSWSRTSVLAEHSKVLNTVDNNCPRVGLDYDENPFAYTWGHLRVRSNKHGSYEMGNKSLAVGGEKGSSDGIGGESAHHLDGPLLPNTRAPVRLFSASNAASALLEHSLQPAYYNQREQFAKNYLQPTDSTLLNPNPASALSPQDNDMANLKAQQPDKCALAKKRKEKRKAKEQENVYVVQSRDGYMGNLSPDEIVRRIEGENKVEKIDEKAKTKSTSQKSSNNNNMASKDVSVPLSVVSKTVKDTGKRKQEKEKRHNGAEKTIFSPKRSLENDNVISSSVKMNGSANSLLNEDTFANSNMSIPSAHIISASEHATNNKDVVVGRSSEQSSEGDSGATAGGADEEMPVDETLDVDDEEQYMSADEGVNSATSDDVYHADELSGISGSRDLMSDGGNYRADDELIIPNSVSSEEAEFIPVTAKSRKKTAPSAMNADRRSANFGIADRAGSIRSSGGPREGMRQRRSSAQLTIETGILRAHHSPSPSERTKYSCLPTRRQLNSLADFIEDSTVVKAQSHKWAQHGGKWHGGGTQSKVAGERHLAPSSLHTSRAASPDRRSSQPSCTVSVRYAAAVANNSHKALPSDLTVYSTGNQGSFAKALLSPPLKDGKVNNVSSLRGLHTSVSGSALNESKKRTLVYDPSDENANPPLPSAHRSPNSDPNMTNTATVHGNIPCRSWADIAKSSRSSTCGTTSHTSDATSQPSPRDVSPEMNSPSSSTHHERAPSSASSLSGSAAEAPKESEPVASCSMAGEAVTQIAGVDDGTRLQGISFFYDPNEPTANFDQRNPVEFNATDLEDFSPSTPLATCPQGSAVFISEERIVKENSRSSRSPAQEEVAPRLDRMSNDGGVVLNLEGGKTITLPAMGTNDMSGAVLVEDRKHVFLVEQLTRHWKTFEQHGPSPIRYKDVAKRATTAAAKTGIC